MRTRVTVVMPILVVALAVASVRPASAQSARPDRTLLWTVVGAAAGAGAGFLIGFHVFDDATYAERKIVGATVAGGAIGGLAGFAIGRTRRGGSSPMRTAGVALHTRTALVDHWSPDSRFRLAGPIRFPMNATGFSRTEVNPRSTAEAPLIAR